MNASCVFCEIVSGNAPAARVAENAEAVAFLTIGPIRDGHTLVIPRRHVVELVDATDAELAAMFKLAADVARRQRRVLGSRGENVVVASGKAGEQSVFHLHVHVVPRHEGDGLDLTSWWEARVRHPARADLDAIAIRLRGHLGRGHADENDEIAAAAEQFVVSFDEVFRVDWTNTRKHLGMRDEDPAAAKQLAEMVGETHQSKDVPLPVFENEDIEDWGNRGGLARARAEVLACVHQRRALEAALTTLLKYFEAVFHTDWAYTCAELGATGFSENETFLRPSRERSQWRKREQLIHDYREACKLLGRESLASE